MNYKSFTIGLAVALAATYLSLTIIFFVYLYPQLQGTQKLSKAVKHAADNDSLCDRVQCDFVPDRAITPPVTAELKQGQYHVPSARFAAQAVAVLEDASLNHHDPQPLPGTQVLAVFSGVENAKTKTKGAAGERMKNMAWILLPQAQPDQVWLSFRGTQTKAEWEIDYTMSLLEFDPVQYPGVLVHQGFWDAVNEMSEDIISVLSSVVQARPNVNIFVCGHSLGASMAIVCTLQLVMRGFKNVYTYVFAPPRVGNQTFVDLVLSRMGKGISSFNALANVADLIPQLPLSVQPNLNTPQTPLLYAQFPLYMFQDNWGSWVHNHIMPVYIANVDNVSLVNTPVGRHGVGSPQALRVEGQTKVPRGFSTALMRKFLFTK